MKNRAELVECTRWARVAEHTCCTLCRGGYGKCSYWYAKVVEGPAEGAIICPDCLKQRNFSERAEITAKRYEQAAKEEVQYAADYLHNVRMLREPVEWDAPTYEEWQSREKAADEEYVADMA